MASRLFSRPAPPLLGAGGAILLALAGCGPQPASGPSTPAGASQGITLTLSPAHPRQMDPTTFTVHVRDLGNATVSIDLTMPSMAMPPNTVMTKPQGPGTYVGTGRFTMAGDWRAVVRVARSEGGTIHTTLIPQAVKVR